ncbi:MAG: 2Fe-2S iron-sulfur cluster binding domain-containing protein [Sphingomonadales bacterium]|nr:2Fe-2S iron-sulfur cluster binding domain-containing protein [Sphingomonadales bacterium]
MTDTAGKVHEITDVAEGQSLMEIGRAHGVAGIFGDCGGGCACATCHVYIGEGWGEKVGQPDDIEFAMLDMVSDVARENSRLGCQVRMSPELDGISVTVAPTAA